MDVSKWLIIAQEDNFTVSSIAQMLRSAAQPDNYTGAGKTPDRIIKGEVGSVDRIRRSIESAIILLNKTQHGVRVLLYRPGCVFTLCYAFIERGVVLAPLGNGKTNRNAVFAKGII